MRFQFGVFGLIEMGKLVTNGELPEPKLLAWERITGRVKRCLGKDGEYGNKHALVMPVVPRGETDTASYILALATNPTCVRAQHVISILPSSTALTAYTQISFV